MRKRSISDQCLVSDVVKKLRQSQNQSNTNECRLSRCKSEDKINNNNNKLLHPLSGANLVALKKGESNRLFPRIFKSKKNLSSTRSSNCSSRSDVGVAQRKNSLLLQTTAFLEFGSYEELNEKIDMIKQSVVDNLNKLKERDVSLQNLEMKADYLNQQALNLNMLSTNIKRQKRKSSVKFRLLVGTFLFVAFSSIYSYLIYFGIG